VGQGDRTWRRSGGRSPQYKKTRRFRSVTEEAEDLQENREVELNKRLIQATMLNRFDETTIDRWVRFYNDKFPDKVKPGGHSTQTSKVDGLSGNRRWTSADELVDPAPGQQRPIP